MAGIVGTLAVLALAFLVVTLIRRRVTAPSRNRPPRNAGTAPGVTTRADLPSVP